MKLWFSIEPDQGTIQQMELLMENQKERRGLLKQKQTPSSYKDRGGRPAPQTQNKQSKSSVCLIINYGNSPFCCFLEGGRCEKQTGV